MNRKKLISQVLAEHRINLRQKEHNPEQEMWDEFCNKWNITMDDLNNRFYSVDNSEPVSLFNLVKINAEAVLESVLVLENYIDLKIILSLQPGETFGGAGMGADIKRVQ